MPRPFAKPITESTREQRKAFENRTPGIRCFTFDGFGNKTAQSVTKGSAPTWSQTTDPLTNRIASGGFGYSASGNLQTTPYSPGGVLEYDQLNRLTTVDRVRRYWYDAANRRVWRSDSGIATFTLYGMDGMVLGTFEWKSRLNGFQAEYWVEKRQANRYLGQRLVWQDGKGILTDRLGSVHVRGTTETNTYYPYGEQKTGDSTQDRQKWGTYWRDSATGMDNAVNRWYSPTAGRFTTPDPYEASGGAGSPQSWNQYVYAENDPVNFHDPTGQMKCWVSGWLEGSAGITATVTCQSNDSLRSQSASFGATQISSREEQRLIAAAKAQFVELDGPQDRDLLPAALERAVAAPTESTCSAVFGTPATRQRGFDPAEILTSLANGGARGRIKFEDKGPKWGIAQTVPVGISGLARSVDMTINSYADGSQYWNHGWRDENARTLLHELGHAFNFIRGAGGFRISNLREIVDAFAFDKLIKEECIP